ncbi:MAG TPA: hypothetical protein PLU49_01895 [Saprospiraceae bacterium]|nr:hypothetical protein [Saprospiraceae bacterium]
MEGKLNEAQLEILKIFRIPMDDDQFKELKRILFEFRAKHIVKEMDEHWEKEGINPDDLLKVHMRTPYK